ncbi:MAG: hypothetical protein O2819_01475 [Planctomycetota bacterium]|nr:hypothetical protein [Planctomycetota bacterium]MDA1105019.1 hypothetical protein [Planctomycetota bacterium]
MRQHQLRSDLERQRVGAFQLPLGLEPVDLPEPVQGFVLDYVPGEEDPVTGEVTPDTYSFQVTVSHERILPIYRNAVQLLGDEVTPVIEVGSRDAFRSLDVFMTPEPIPVGDFLRGFGQYRAVLMEDANIGIGANSDEPFVEVFLDSWKGLLINVPIAMRWEVERMLHQHDLAEVPETWPLELDRRATSPTVVRDVLSAGVPGSAEPEDLTRPDFEEVLMQLREMFGLELNVDRSSNLDEGGRPLGRTLWYAVALARPIDPEAVDSDRTATEGAARSDGAYVNLWLAATCLDEVEDLVESRLEELDLEYLGLYSCDRVAHDERPEALNDLSPRPATSEVFFIDIDPW